MRLAPDQGPALQRPHYGDGFGEVTARRPKKCGAGTPKAVGRPALQDGAMGNL